MPVIDLFAFRLSNQIAKYFAWKRDPHSLATDAMQREWNQEILYAFPPFSLIQRVLCKIAKEKVSTVILITPALQTQPWYPNLLAMSFTQPFLLPMSPGVLKDPKGEYHPLGNTTSGLEGYREYLVKSGISERAAHLIVNSKKQSSPVNYNSSWKKWSSWCYSKQIDPFRCPINYVLDFVACLYEEGYAHRSINCYRSAISSFHQKIEGLPVGKHPEVCTLLTGVFNFKPPQPRYSSTWDVQIVLEFIKNNWTDNKSLPNKNLTLKFTV